MVEGRRHDQEAPTCCKACPYKSSAYVQLAHCAATGFYAGFDWNVFVTHSNQPPQDICCTLCRVNENYTSLLHFVLAQSAAAAQVRAHSIAEYDTAGTEAAGSGAVHAAFLQAPLLPASQATKRLSLPVCTGCRPQLLPLAPTIPPGC
eukprot:GHRQ01029729.1.p2 GENE.GHRQ01029729.1~~GHRQ01029729.1.p2  ORF type:complete len:148 (-),score=17.13 GHRQ01029729.1:277-720(-)